MPGVAESAVIGVPHADFGEAVVAWSCQGGRGAGRRRHAGRAEGAHRQLQGAQRLHVVDELPRNAMGKVQKNVLRETYKAL